MSSLVVLLPVLDRASIGEGEECASIHWVNGCAEYRGYQGLQEDEWSVRDEEGLGYNVPS